MKLCDVPKKSKIIFVKILADKKIKGRLFQLGIFEGARGEVVKFSPFKTNILIKTGGNSVGIRKSLAKNIIVSCFEREGLIK